MFAGFCLSWLQSHTVYSLYEVDSVLCILKKQVTVYDMSDSDVVVVCIYQKYHL